MHEQRRNSSSMKHKTVDFPSLKYKEDIMAQCLHIIYKQFGN